MSAAPSPKYGLHADRYRRFRPGYPDGPFDRAAALCGEPRALAVELGAGSGQATPQILRRFSRVVAIEPDAEMAALIPSDPRLEVRVERAEEATLPQPLDAVFSATAFHWMDNVRVGRMVATALRPGGVFLVFGYQPFVVVGPEPARKIVDAEWDLWRAHMDVRLSGWRPYPELLRESAAFSSIEEVSFEFREERTPEATAGLFLTTSFAAQFGRATGDEEAYCADFTRRVAAAAEGRAVTVQFVVTGALAQV
jgi:SAM-dependent methyltransferase